MRPSNRIESEEKGATMEEVVRFLKEAGTFFLATCEGTQPRVRPFGAVVVFEDKLYLDTNNKKEVYKQLQANPRFEVCAAKPDGEWLRVAATAVFDERAEAKRAMLEGNPGLERMYSVDDGIMAVFSLRDATATFSSIGGTPRTITF